MKRILALVLSLLMMASVALADTSILNTESIMPVVTRPITLKVACSIHPAHTDYNEMYMWQTYADMTGINIDWDITPDATWTERKNLLLNSNDLPDVLLRSKITNIEAANYGADQGLLIDLSPMLEEYAPNLTALMDQYPEIRPALTIDGGIYTLPLIIPANGPRTRAIWINEEWLEKCNLEMPTTLEEFYDMLIAFKNCDWNGNGAMDEYPIAWNSGRDVDMFSSFAGIFGCATLGSASGWFDLDAEGNTRFYPISDRYKEMLSFLNKLWKEGLIDTDSLTQSSAQLIVKADDGLVGVCPVLNGPYFLGNDAANFVAMPALTNAWGERMWTNANNCVQGFGTAAITCNCENPEAALRWLDYFYSDDGVILLMYGTEGYTFEYDENGKPVYTELVMDSSLGLTTDQLTGRFLPCASSNLPLIQLPELAYDITNPIEFRRQEMGSILEEYTVETLWSPNFTADEARELSSLSTDLDTYVKEMRLKFMTGDADLDTEWDSFVKTLKDMGMARYMAIYTEAYNRTYGK